MTSDQPPESQTDLLFCVVGTAHEWAGFDMGKSHRESFCLELGEFGWIIEAGNRQMISRGLQVLTDGHDVTLHSPQIVQDAADLAERFAHAHDEARLRRHASFFRAPE